MTRHLLVWVLSCAVIFHACAAGKKGAAPTPGEWTEARSLADRRLASLLDAGSFEAALRIADSLIAARENDARVIGQKARALAGLGEDAEAVALFEDALLKDYESCENHLNFATYLVRTGKTGRALTEFTEAKRFCDGANIPIVYRNLAVSAMKLGKLDEARQYTEEGLGVSRNDPYLLGLKGMLIVHENPVEAESLFVKSQQLGAASPEFLVQYGLLLLNAGRSNEAGMVFERIVAQKPGDREARMLLAEALDRSGKYGEAETLLRTLQERGDDAEVKAKLAKVLFHKGAFEESLELYMSLEPSPEVMDRIAMCLHSLGRSDEALSWERKALAAKPGWTQAMINLSVILGAKGQIDEASALLERVLEVEPDNAVARTNLERLREARTRR